MEFQLMQLFVVSYISAIHRRRALNRYNIVSQLVTRSRFAFRKKIVKKNSSIASSQETYQLNWTNRIERHSGPIITTSVHTHTVNAVKLKFYTSLTRPKFFLNISSQTIERVNSYKLLGIHIDSFLSWSIHIDHIIKRTTTRLYFLKQLKRSGLSNTHLLHFYITVIRPVLEYCAPVWHYVLTTAQSESIEAVQKRAIHIIYN